MFYVLLARISPVIEKSTIGAILNNASSPFDFNANFSARRSSRRGFSGKRTAIAGMTAVSLALSGLAVPSVVGGEVQVAGAQAGKVEAGKTGAISYAKGSRFYGIVNTHQKPPAGIDTVRIRIDPKESARERFLGTDSFPVKATVRYASTEYTVDATATPDSDGRGFVFTLAEQVKNLPAGGSISFKADQQTTADKVRATGGFTNASGHVEFLLGSASYTEFVRYEVNGEGAGVAPGITVRLLKESNREEVTTAITDENGYFSFRGVPRDQKYIVEVVPPAGYQKPKESPWDAVAQGDRPQTSPFTSYRTNSV